MTSYEQLRIDQLFKKTFALVEADSYARLQLFFEIRAHGFAVEQVSLGAHEEVGMLLINLRFEPVCIDVTWFIVEGLYVGFWQPVSRFFDMQLVEKWFAKRVPQVGPHWQRDAMNIGTVLGEIERQMGNSLPKAAIRPCDVCHGMHCMGVHEIASNLGEKS